MNTKTLLIAGIAATASAELTNHNVQVNVDDKFYLFWDGVQVGDAKHEWNTNFDMGDIQVDSDREQMLSIYAVDYIGGYRISVQIDNQGTKQEDWHCKWIGSTYDLDLSQYHEWTAVDFDEDANGYGPAGNANSESRNLGEAFWAQPTSSAYQASTAICRYHGDLLPQGEVDYTEMHEELTRQINEANDELNFHNDNAGYLSDTLQLYENEGTEYHDSKRELENANQQLGTAYNELVASHEALSAELLGLEGNHAEELQKLVDELADALETMTDPYEGAYHEQQQLIEQAREANYQAAQECQLNADGDTHQICTRVWKENQW